MNWDNRKKKKLMYHYKVTEKEKNPKYDSFYEGLNPSLDGVLAGIKGVLTGIKHNEQTNFKIEIDIQQSIYQIIEENMKEKLPARAIHTTSDGYETEGILIKILPNDYPDENVTSCIFKPDDGPELELDLDEIKIKAN